MKSSRRLFDARRTFRTPACTYRRSSPYSHRAAISGCEPLRSVSCRARRGAARGTDRIGSIPRPSRRHHFPQRLDGPAASRRRVGGISHPLAVWPPWLFRNQRARPVKRRSGPCGNRQCSGLRQPWREKLLDRITAGADRYSFWDPLSPPRASEPPDRASPARSTSSRARSERRRRAACWKQHIFVDQRFHVR